VKTPEPRRTIRGRTRGTPAGRPIHRCIHWSIQGKGEGNRSRSHISRAHVGPSLKRRAGVTRQLTETIERSTLASLLEVLEELCFPVEAVTSIAPATVPGAPAPLMKNRYPSICISDGRRREPGYHGGD
jgi:hypothetical protein